MKSVLTFIAAIAVVFLISACSRGKEEAAPEAKSEKEAEPQSRVKHGTNGEVIVTLDAATQKLMGLQTAPLQTVQLSPEIKAYGRVLDITPLAAVVAELKTAQAASAASQAELQRLQTLAAQNNASERSLQAAQATAAHDRAQADSAKLRLEASWGTSLATRQDLPDLVQSISSLNAALVEVDVPAGQPLNEMPTSARLFTLADENKPIEAQFVGPSPQVDQQLQGRGFLFLVSPNPARLTAGASVTGLLSLAGEPQTGIILPRAAVVRFNGTTWVYLQTAEISFERRETTLNSPLADGWFVHEGLKPGDKVVTVAAQQILSEELKGQSGE